MLPDDVLREIFAYCLPQDAPATFSPSSLPLLLCHVCSSWRNVAMSQASLWTRLRLEARKGDPRKQVKLREQLFAEWMPRCKKAKIHLQIVFYVARGIAVSPPTSTLFSFLKPFATPSYTISRLNLINLPLIFVHSLPENSFPSLERLVLKMTKNYYQKRRWTKGPIKAFSSCPLLRRVALAGTYMTHAEFLIDLPWKQLTHLLFMERPHYDFYEEVVSKMQDLRFAALGVSESTSGRVVSYLGPHVKPVIFQHLSTLVLSFNFDLSMDFAHPDFFWEWEFPNLHSLRLDSGFMDFDNIRAWFPATRDSFLNKLSSLANLRLLSIDMNEVTYSTYEQLFESVPQITTLELHLCDQFSNALQALEFHPKVARVLPSLKTLILDVSDQGQYEILAMDGFPDEAVVDFEWLEEVLRSRRDCAPENQLEKVIVYGSEPWQFESDMPFIDVLEEYAERGLELEFKLIEEPRRERGSELWSDRDPSLVDWPEVMDIFDSQYEGEPPNHYSLRSDDYLDSFFHSDSE